MANERTTLDDVKLALRLTTQAYDNELTDLIDAALLDLGVAGVTEDDQTNALIKRAIVTYCKVHFGSPADFDRLKKIYDEQKAQLGMATDYTDWGDS
jgi:hypothetical protein